MPRIGMRIIKTAIAVFLCLLIDYLRGAAMPIFAPLAAILSMQRDAHESLTVAVHRVSGTVLGGLYGLGILSFITHVLIDPHPFLQYFLIALFIIPLIYLTVLIKEPSATYISCVLYIVIVIPNIAMIPPHLFAFHRTMDTIIGILVSLLVNVCLFPARKDEVREIIHERIHFPRTDKEEQEKGKNSL